MSIDAATVRRIAHLARVAVADDEVEHLRGEINAILSFVEQLSEVNVEGVEPMTSVTPMVMKKRHDVVTDGDDRGRGAAQRAGDRAQLFPRSQSGRITMCMACEEMQLFYAYLDAVEEAKRKAQPWECEVTLIPQGDEAAAAQPAAKPAKTAEASPPAPVFLRRDRMSELTALTIAAARDGLKQKKFSAAELADAHLAAMEKARALNAYVLETPERALAMAKASDARIAKGDAGPLEGVPLAHQGHVLHRGRAHDGLLAHPRQFRADL